MSFGGYLYGRRRYPYLYCLYKADHVYLGMTLKHPCIRWSSSLVEGGSFFEALHKRDPHRSIDDAPVLHLIFECHEVAEKTDISEWRNVVCYAEHALHVLFSSNGWINGRRLTVISDTTRTAPLICRHTWAEDLSLQAYEVFKGQLGKLV